MATPRVSFRSPPPERRRLLRAAESLGTTPSAVCRHALQEFLSGLEKRQLITASTQWHQRP